MTLLASCGCEETTVSCSKDMDLSSLACLGISILKLATNAPWLRVNVWALGLVQRHWSMRSFLCSLRVAGNGRTSPCGFLFRSSVDFVFSGGVSVREALVVSSDLVSPDCVLCRGSSTAGLLMLVASLPVLLVLRVK